MPVSIVGHAAVWNLWTASFVVTIVTLAVAVGLYRAGWGRSFDRRGAWTALAVSAIATIVGLLVEYVWFAANSVGAGVRDGDGMSPWDVLGSPSALQILDGALRDPQVWGDMLDDVVSSAFALLIVGGPLATQTWKKRSPVPLGR